MSWGDSVSLIIPPGPMIVSEAPGVIKTNLSPMSPRARTDAMTSSWSFTCGSSLRVTRARSSARPSDSTLPTRTFKTRDRREIGVNDVSGSTEQLYFAQPYRQIAKADGAYQYKNTHHDVSA